MENFKKLGLTDNIVQILEQKGFKLEDGLEQVLAENRTKSQGFNSTGKK